MATQLSTSRAYCRVVMCSPGRVRLGKSQSSVRRPRSDNQAASASRVESVISKGTGRPVFCWMTVRTLSQRPSGRHVAEAKLDQVAPAEFRVDPTIE